MDHFHYGLGNSVMIMANLAISLSHFFADGLNSKIFPELVAGLLSCYERLTKMRQLKKDIAPKSVVNLSTISINHFLFSSNA
jgi:hypothetical protein